MSEMITINTGEMAVGEGQMRIKTSGIGSCIVIILYDDIAKLGGMAHAMLPTAKRPLLKGRIATPDHYSPGKYADEAIDRLLEEIVKIGGRKEQCKAKLIGGAKMFKNLSGDDEGVGYQNLVAARDRLANLKIPVEFEEVGGTSGRIAELDLSNGIVEVTTKF